MHHNGQHHCLLHHSFPHIARRQNISVIHGVTYFVLYVYITLRRFLLELKFTTFGRLVCASVFR
jgi:hypothetical protein